MPAAGAAGAAGAEAVSWRALGSELGLVSHVVASLHGYLATQCAATPWPALARAVARAPSVAALRAAHEVHEKEFKIYIF